MNKRVNKTNSLVSFTFKTSFAKNFYVWKSTLEKNQLRKAKKKPLQTYSHRKPSQVKSERKEVNKTKVLLILPVP